MKLLLAMPSGGERERISKVLSARGHTLHVFEPDKVPIASADVAIVGHADGRGWIRRIRSAESSPRVYILAVLFSLEAKAIDGALAEGADDIVMLGAGAAELAARVDGLSRILKWSIAPTNESASPAGLVAWAEAQQALAQEVGQVFGIPMVDAPADRRHGMPTLAAEVILAGATVEWEARVVVGLTPKNGETMAELVLGGKATPDVLNDCLREIANTLGGALKRSILAEGVTLTIGLPQDREGDLVLRSDRVWLAQGSDYAVHVGLSWSSNRTLTVRGPALEPGMVLKHDARNAQGSLLIAAGTAITTRTVERLVELFGPTALFEVIAPSGTGSQRTSNQAVRTATAS